MARICSWHMRDGILGEWKMKKRVDMKDGKWKQRKRRF
ncbi:conserved hypothetical protein [delta proteobacterium NaphS2]|nr:conserved hypothetical protein [delta proteobacterium NaphS2]